jgi:NAD(P)-dependent dehydrogenase (short-subunit alcohol dehydrogenase family)
MTTIAIVGAGPGLGLAIARTFGSRGFEVALISRSREKLESLVAQLAQDGITAAAFPADVRDRPALTQALADAASRFGRIDVLGYSPVAKEPGSNVLATPANLAPDAVQPEIESQLYGAITATRAVLPALREAGTGTLLFHRRWLGRPGPGGRHRERRSRRTAFPVAPAAEIAKAYWDLHVDRAKSEFIFKKKAPFELTDLPYF